MPVVQMTPDAVQRLERSLLIFTERAKALLAGVERDVERQQCFDHGPTVPQRAGEADALRSSCMFERRQSSIGRP